MTPVKALSSVYDALAPEDRALLKPLRAEQRAAAAELRRARLAGERLRAALIKVAAQEPRLTNFCSSELEAADRIARGLPPVS